MKKNRLLLPIVFLFSVAMSLNCVFATEFSEALRICKEYKKDGSATYNNQIFNLRITLEPKGDKCVYKEKIYQGKDYQMLTCNFTKSILPWMADSMQRYSEMFKKEIAKNDIFDSKMTTNGEVFQKYIADPQYCSISHSKK